MGTLCGRPAQQPNTGAESKSGRRWGRKHSKTEVINASNVAQWIGIMGLSLCSSPYLQWDYYITRSLYPNDSFRPSLTFANSHHLLLVPAEPAVVTRGLGRDAAWTPRVTFWLPSEGRDFSSYREASCVQGSFKTQLLIYCGSRESLYSVIDGYWLTFCFLLAPSVHWKLLVMS